MAYVIKDLLIDISAAQMQKPELHLPICRCSYYTNPCFCTIQGTLCPHASVVVCPHGSVFPCLGGSAPCFTSDLPRLTDYITETVMWTPQAGPIFKGLKEYLHQAIGQIDIQEKAVAKGLTPQTVVEAEQLETKLKEALKEVTAMKETLK